MRFVQNDGINSAIRSIWQNGWHRQLWAHRISRKIARSESGAAMVEMAIASTVFFAMFFGLIYIGFAMYVYNFISDAAREGARFAIVRGSDCTGFTECASATIPNGATPTQIQDYVRSLGYPGIDPTKITVNVKWYELHQGDTSTATSYTLCAPGASDGRYYTNTSGDKVACNSYGNTVQVQVIYALPFSIPFWRATTLTMGSATELTIAQ